MPSGVSLNQPARGPSRIGCPHPYPLHQNWTTNIFLIIVNRAQYYKNWCSDTYQIELSIYYEEHEFTNDLQWEIFSASSYSNINLLFFIFITPFRLHPCNLIAWVPDTDFFLEKQITFITPPSPPPPPNKKSTFQVRLFLLIKKIYNCLGKSRTGPCTSHRCCWNFLLFSSKETKKTWFYLMNVNV